MSEGKEEFNSPAAWVVFGIMVMIDCGIIMFASAFGRRKEVMEDHEEAYETLDDGDCRGGVLVGIGLVLGFWAVAGFAGFCLTFWGN